MTSGPPDAFGAMFGLAIFVAAVVLVVQATFPLAMTWKSFFYSAGLHFSLGVVVVCVVGAFAWVSMKLGK